jgi:hypothetical protein
MKCNGQGVLYEDASFDCLILNYITKALRVSTIKSILYKYIRIVFDGRDISRYIPYKSETHRRSYCV